MNANNRFEAACEAVAQLELSPIKTKLMHAASGEGWDLDRTNAVEKEYRRFLCLMATFPDESIAPLVDVDTFWHYHILDTMKYAADCEQAFGYFLHHFPYVGLRGDDDEQCRIDSGERMRTVYQAMFGEAMPVPAAASAGPAMSDTVATAWCAGPGAKVFVQPGGTAIAWCAGPGARLTQSAGAESAWCAGPGARLVSQAVGGATAWCAGPGAKRLPA